MHAITTIHSSWNCVTKCHAYKLEPFTCQKGGGSHNSICHLSLGTEDRWHQVAGGNAWVHSWASPGDASISPALMQSQLISMMSTSPSTSFFLFLCSIPVGFAFLSFSLSRSEEPGGIGYTCAPVELSAPRIPQYHPSQLGKFNWLTGANGVGQACSR